jgi:hypothetical protein
VLASFREPNIRTIPILLLAPALMACHPRPGRPVAFTLSYWCWPAAGDRYAAAATRAPVDRLYVHVGRLTAAGLADARWPAGLPRASAYVAVWRADAAAVPEPAVIEPLVRHHQRLRREAAQAGQPLRGLQLDVDCPTGELGRYAAFLRGLRGRLPAEQELSITALLDWFRGGTGVERVVAEVDEYVPQFYDAAPAGASLRIAEPIDPERWGEAFEELGRPYRIGLATFGRILRARLDAKGSVERVAFRDLSPLDLPPEGLEPLRSALSAAGEVVVRRRVTLPGRYLQLVPGDVIEMVLPTADSLRSGERAVRSWGGRCAGIVLFRWPGAGESLVLTPAEVEDALAGAPRSVPPPRLVVTEGTCAPRRCTDLAVSVGDRYRPDPLRLRLRASAEIEYLLPARPASLAVSGARHLSAAVPAYPGVEVVPLGRVFTRLPARFSLEE